MEDEAKSADEGGDNTRAPSRLGQPSSTDVSELTQSPIDSDATLSPTSVQPTPSEEQPDDEVTLPASAPQARSSDESPLRSAARTAPTASPAPQSTDKELPRNPSRSDRTSPKPRAAPAKIPRGTGAKKESLKGAGGEELRDDSQRSLYDLEWKHDVATETPKPAPTTTEPPESPYKTGPLIARPSTRVSVDLGPMFAKRGEKDLRQVDQSVNLMEHNRFNDNDSLDSNKSPTQSQVSASSRRSRGRKSLTAPGRPSKFATRPSHVNVHRTDIDTSLLGVVEGRMNFRSQRDKQYMVNRDVADVGVAKPDNSKTAWGKTKGVFMLLVKLLVVAAFIAYGVFINLAYSEGGSSAASSTSTKSGLVMPPISYKKEISIKADREVDGGIKSKAGETEDLLTSDGGTDDALTENDWEVHLSAHVSHPPTTPPRESNSLQHLESIILRHEISLSVTLNYTNHATNPQVKALMWLAHSDAYKSAETSRDVQSVKLLQRYALGVFYYSLGGHHQPLYAGHTSQSEHGVHILDDEEEKTSIDSYQGWRRTSNWMSDRSVCDWYGVTCNNDDMVVVSLNLTDNGLRGSLPMLELFQALRETLKSFDVSHNAIKGSLSLPSSIGIKPWVRLEHFYVNDNRITGRAPFEWFESSASPVLGINMARNLLSGLPHSGISNLEALKELYLSCNVLDGSLPRISNLPSLQILHLNDNALRGTIPREIFHLTALVDFRAGNNSLTGTMPNDLPLLHNLEILSLERNALRGHIPDHFYSMPNLKSMNLSSNEFSGTLPRTLSNVTQIENLSLEDNNLSGIFPTSYAALTKLRYLLLDHNDMYGSIPEDFCKLKAGIFHLNSLNWVEMDCLYEINCECCDKCH